MKRNPYLFFGFLCGFIASVMSIYLWYVAIIRDETIKGLFLVFLFFILFPAIFGLVSSFVSTGIWFALCCCFLYVVSAILKFKGVNKLSSS